MNSILIHFRPEVRDGVFRAGGDKWLLPAALPLLNFLCLISSQLSFHNFFSNFHESFLTSLFLLTFYIIVIAIAGVFSLLVRSMCSNHFSVCFLENSFNDLTPVIFSINSLTTLSFSALPHTIQNNLVWVDSILLISFPFLAITVLHILWHFYYTFCIPVPQFYQQTFPPDLILKVTAF